MRALTPSLLQMVAVASEMRIPIRPLRFYRGVMMDHLPFVRLGIPAISLTGISTEGWHLHTPGDTFSLLQEEGLAEAIEIIFALSSSPKGAPEN